MKKSHKGFVYLIGAGPGDPGLITARGLELLREANVIIYDALLDPQLLEAAPGAKKICLGKNASNGVLKKRSDQHRINTLMVRYARQGLSVARLKGGDPFIFGRGGEEALYLSRHGIPFEIIPGVSSGTGVPSSCGIPLTDRRLSSSVTFVTAHEDPEKIESRIDWKRLAAMPGTLVLFMGVRKLREIAGKLISYGKSPATPSAIIQSGTLQTQKIWEGTLGAFAKDGQYSGIQAPALVIVGDVVKLRGQFSSPGSQPLKNKKILVTRASSQSGTLVRVLRALGAEVEELPAIEILPPKNWKPVDDAIRNLDEDWLVLTSTNGVDAFCGRVMKTGDMRLLSGIKIAAIGTATAEALRRFGLKPDFMPKKFTSEGLLAELRQKNEIRGKRFLLARTDIAPRYLADELRKSGGRVKEVTVYRTVPAVQRGGQHGMIRQVLSGEMDYITFTSASTVRHFLSRIPKASRRRIKSRLISIGPVTSRELKENGLNPYREAREHTIPGLIEVLSHDK